MSFYSDLYNFLQVQPALTAKLGTGDDFALYPREARDPSFPYVVYTTVSEVSRHSHLTNYRNVTVQFSIFSRQYTECEEIKDILRDIFVGMRGGFSNTAVGAVFQTTTSDLIAEQDNSFGMRVGFQFQGVK